MTRTISVLEALSPRSSGRRPAGLRAAQVAGVVGLAYAAVSVYWGLGGTALLATVGGDLAERAREGGTLILLVVWLAAAIKAVAAALPLLVFIRPFGSTGQRAVGWLAWTEAVVLTGYGLVLTAVGLLVEADVVSVASDADHRALTWHAFFWDPWFLLWGLLVLTAMVQVRRQRRTAAPSVDRRDPA